MFSRVVESAVTVKINPGIKSAARKSAFNSNKGRRISCSQNWGQCYTVLIIAVSLSINRRLAVRFCIN